MIIPLPYRYHQFITIITLSTWTPWYRCRHILLLMMLIIYFISGESLTLIWSFNMDRYHTHTTTILIRRLYGQIGNVLGRKPFAPGFKSRNSKVLITSGARSIHLAMHKSAHKRFHSNDNNHGLTKIWVGFYFGFINFILYPDESVIRHVSLDNWFQDGCFSG